MKHLPVHMAIAVLASIGSANAEDAAQEPLTQNPVISNRDVIKAARAKDAEREKAEGPSRAWDRDAAGKRPWETQYERPPK